MSATLTETRGRSLTVDYDHVRQPRPRTPRDKQASSVSKRTRNRNTKVWFEQDVENPFRYTLHYQGDRMPSREDVNEWFASALFFEDYAVDRRITVAVIFYGNEGQGEKEVKFEIRPGDIMGGNASW